VLNDRDGGISPAKSAAVLVDARTIPENTAIETDVCIVGAGAAGITLAKEFAGQGFRVGLLESGGFEFDEKTQDLYRGENVGFPIPLNMMRLRYFGGSTNHWGNYCRALDEIDFEKRDWVPHSGWPFKKSELDSYYERAQKICQLGPFAYNSEFWQSKSSPPLRFVGNRVVTAIFQTREPATRFGMVYRKEIISAGNINTFLYANVLNIETDDAARIVTRLRVGCLQGNKFVIAAKLFILATGAIENARLLLLSNDVNSAGLGNQNGLVGRFFMSHALSEPALFLPSDPLIPATLYINSKPAVDNLRVTGHLTLSHETQRHHKLLNFNAVLFPVYVAQTGLMSLKRLIKREFDTLAKELRNVIGDLDGVATAAYWKLFKGIIPVQAFSLTCAIELSSERDALGKQRVCLDWQLRAVDKASLRRSLEILGTELGRAGLGRLKIDLKDRDESWPDGIRDAGHHLGTTRMHLNPQKGVVDENCCVHGMSNLFVAGSSVFPTSGHANPTLTLIALALRLADHVKRIMV
jgi:choline dehydrogenase-like flavoprotein